MSSGSLKDVVKSIHNQVSSGVLPLSNDLIDHIQAYLDKHLPIEDGDSQKLQEELLSIWQKQTQDKPDRYSIFIAILRELIPAIRSAAQWLQWWEMFVVPVLGNIGDGKGLARETRQLLLAVLLFEADDGDSARIEAARETCTMLSDKVLGVWLSQSRVATTEADAMAHYLDQQIKTLLLAFGQKRPQILLTAIDKYFVKREHRGQVLSLLSEFIRHGPPHLHLLLQTPLFDNLLRCLQIDTSTTVVALAMTALTMILPHIPVSTGKHLPSLFNIYTRMLFWERERALSPRLRLDSNEQNDNSESSEKGQEEKVPWEKLSYSFQSDDETLPELLHYFTFLYGLYPINFMSYIRKPSRYLRHANFPGADDIDVEPNEIRKRSEPFRELHLLHPNFFSLTIESELTDAHRWMNSAASDVVTFCMSLCVPVYHGSSSAPPMTRFSSLPNRDSNQDIPAQTLLTQTDSEEALIAQRHSHETPSSGGGPPELSALARLSSRTNPSVSSDVHMTTNLTQDIRSDSPGIPNQRGMSPLHDILNSQQSLHRGLHQSLPNESSTTLSSVGGNTDSSANVDTYLQSLAQLPPRSPSLRPSLGDTTNMAFLRREIMLLRNDLNFERYLKQQHLSHIGQLRRMQVREATVEAETQNLINANKILKGKLEEAKNLTTQAKKESDKSRAQSKKWEQDLSAKLRAIKDEQKKWILEGDLLRRDLQESQENSEELKQLVIKSEAREMESSRKLQAIKIELDDLAKLRSDVDRLTEHLREFQNQESEMEDVKTREDIANSKIELLNMQLKAREEELLKTKRANAAEIQDLKLHMKDVAHNAHSTATQNFKMMLDSALAASKLRLAEVHKAHTHLLRRYTSLQEDYLRLQEQHSTPGPLLGDSDEIESLESRSPTDTRNMPHRQPRRDSEDPQRLGHGGADNGSRQRSFSPDEQRKMSAATGSMMIPTRTGSSTHSDPRSLFNGGSLDNGAEAEMPKPKPQRRAYGRGGVQNSGLKEKREKDKKERERRESEVDSGSQSPTHNKKDKKGGPGGFKSIKGLVSM
ncbi:hypothetical protein VF21_02670 [Pseudogymnoascus sp. 05NY08]|nr:hypothetical protein VF21_02670 [Pseudogymnoascus sp. 05NY08]